MYLTKFTGRLKALNIMFKMIGLIFETLPSLRSRKVAGNGAHQNLWGTLPQGTKISFCGLGLEFFDP